MEDMVQPTLSEWSCFEQIKMAKKFFQSPFVTVLVKRTAFFVKHFVRLEKALN